MPGQAFHAVGSEIDPRFSATMAASLKAGTVMRITGYA